MLLILAKAGVALEFETGRQIAVEYPDRCSDHGWGVAKPDFYHRRARLAIFCDSEAYHSSAEARARDNGVSSALQLIGVKAIRFTGGQIIRDPHAVGLVVRLSSEQTTAVRISGSERSMR